MERILPSLFGYDTKFKSSCHLANTMKDEQILNCDGADESDGVSIIIIIIIITEHLTLHPKMQANSNAHVFLLSIILALKQMSFQPFLEGRERN